MKKFILMLLSAVAIVPLYAQDIIVTHESERIEAKVYEVSETEVRYKRSDNPDGPIFVMSADKIATIVFENGSVQTFSSRKNNYNPMQVIDNSGAAPQNPAEESWLWYGQNKKIDTPAEGPWLLYGLNIKEGMNMYIKSAVVKDNTRYKSAIGLRFLPNVEAFVEFAPKQTNMADNRSAIYFGLQYAFRGGTISSNVVNAPVNLDLQYLCFRPAYSVSSRYFYSRMGIELGVLTKATWKDDQDSQSYSIRKECNKATVGIWQELGGIISDHFTIGICLEYIVSNSTKKVWTANSYSPHFNIQLALGWRFNPYKIDKKRVEKIRDFEQLP